MRTLYVINQNSDFEKHDYLVKYFMIIEEEVSLQEILGIPSREFNEWLNSSLVGCFS